MASKKTPKINPLACLIEGQVHCGGWVLVTVEGADRPPRGESKGGNETQQVSGITVL